MEILLNSSANKTKKFELKMDRFFKNKKSFIVHVCSGTKIGKTTHMQMFFLFAYAHKWAFLVYAFQKCHQLIGFSFSRVLIYITCIQIPLILGMLCLFIIWNLI